MNWSKWNVAAEDTTTEEAHQKEAELRYAIVPLDLEEEKQVTSRFMKPITSSLKDRLGPLILSAAKNPHIDAFKAAIDYDLRAIPLLYSDS
ncbi:hypothetical protein FNYG_06167 [Fusarium nygamai]|uniref:Uncharacterized protein n=1 Tax=Gibberella nygamai TaxID=42673 RepID=A0A2K0WE69_GIBNY|nr:hypothetical protein FNYG_06167 [Fusarium nygamai]